jgi:hypothetical protein
VVAAGASMDCLAIDWDFIFRKVAQVCRTILSNDCGGGVEGMQDACSSHMPAAQLPKSPQLPRSNLNSNLLYPHLTSKHG